MTMTEDEQRMSASEEKDLIDAVRDTAVGRSIWRTPRKRTPRDAAAGHWSSFVLHIYPVKVREAELGFKYSWYLGVISTVLFGSLIASGMYLMFFYVPSPGQAYADVQTIQTEVAFGQYVRNVHRWSAHLMVLSVAMHMAKVFYRGAYKAPREFNWVIGVLLLLLTLLLSFTGYLLPWGPAGVLGRHGGFGDGGLRTIRRRADKGATPRLPGSRLRSAPSFLCAPRRCSADHVDHRDHVPLVALAEGLDARARARGAPR